MHYSYIIGILVILVILVILAFILCLRKTQTGGAETDESDEPVNEIEKKDEPEEPKKPKKDDEEEEPAEKKPAAEPLKATMASKPKASKTSGCNISLTKDNIILQKTYPRTFKTLTTIKKKNKGCIVTEQEGGSSRVTRRKAHKTHTRNAPNNASRCQLRVTPQYIYMRKGAQSLKVKNTNGIMGEEMVRQMDKRYGPCTIIHDARVVAQKLENIKHQATIGTLTRAHKSEVKQLARRTAQMDAKLVALNLPNTGTQEHRVQRAVKSIKDPPYFNQLSTAHAQIKSNQASIDDINLLNTQTTSHTISLKKSKHNQDTMFKGQPPCAFFTSSNPVDVLEVQNQGIGSIIKPRYTGYAY